MAKDYNKFKFGKQVQVSQAYLDDEASVDEFTTPTAKVFAEPSDEEELVGIRYETGCIDYVPQDFLEIIEE